MITTCSPTYTVTIEILDPCGSGVEKDGIPHSNSSYISRLLMVVGLKLNCA